MAPTPQDISEALRKAGIARLPAPAVAYLGERMLAMDLTRLNLGGLRDISAGCSRPEIGSGSPSVATFPDLDSAARALVAVSYRAAPRAWGDVGEPELATLGSYPIQRVKVGDAVADLEKNLDHLSEQVAGLAADVAKIGDSGEPRTDEPRWAYYRIFDDGAHWLPGFDVSTNRKDDLRIMDARVRTKLADEPPNSVLVYREWTDGIRGGNPVVVKDNYEPGRRPAMARQLGIEGSAEGWTYYRDRGEDLETLEENIRDTKHKDAELRAKVADEPDVYIFRQRGKLPKAEIVTVIDRRIPSEGFELPGSVFGGTIGASEGWTYYRQTDDGPLLLASDIKDTGHKDAEIRVKMADEPDVFVYRTRGNKSVTVISRSVPGEGISEMPVPPAEFEGAIGATPGPIPGLPSAEDLAASAQQIISQVTQGPAPVPAQAQFPPEYEATMRALLADWEGFDRLGVGTKILPDLRPAVVQFRTLRDAWKVGPNDPATVKTEIDAAIRAAGQVRDALQKSGVVDPALGPAAVKAAQEAQAALQKASSGSGSIFENVPILKWLNDPKGPKVRVEAETTSIIPAEYRAPAAFAFAGLIVLGGWAYLSGKRAKAK